MFLNEAIEEKFMLYLMDNENPSLWRLGRPGRHKSPEGGNDTIGFGHKLTDDEVRTGRVYAFKLDDELTIKNYLSILRSDLVRAKITLTQRLERNKKVWYPDLPSREQCMLLDFEFNLGNVVRKFPKFTQAVLDGDVKGQREEFKRYYKDPYDGWKLLNKRNMDFYDTFLSTEAIRWWEAQAEMED